nr:MAG TPA: hypothetical protein [Caudoviricetes sp.]DAS89314.1 MAG TPA: hypothetical protein [Caudoviricetes sp.]
MLSPLLIHKHLFDLRLSYFARIVNGFSQRCPTMSCNVL